MLDPAGIAKGIDIIDLGFSPLDDLLNLINVIFIDLAIIIGIREVSLFILAIQDALQIAYILFIDQIIAIRIAEDIQGELLGGCGEDQQ
ncbi:MAG: hypothetical protein A4E43_01462 [Methanosaeta sp. PtaB.Bin005]|nr:MAG: hypothetical protein A4E43_01462 [Methanosaeta sp. PtaB.Bin005]